MERRRFSQTMASEWQTAFVVSHKMSWCALLTAVKNYSKSLEKLQDFFFKTETKTETKCSRPRPRLRDPRPRPRLSFLSPRRLETKTLVSWTTSLNMRSACLRIFGLLPNPRRGAFATATTVKFLQKIPGSGSRPRLPPKSN